MIYPPAEDSYLLQEALKEFLNDKSKKIRVLDMGSGSGIQAKTCTDLGFKDVLAVDINPEVINHLNKQKFKFLQSDLFSKIDKNKKYDLIVFNAPYLPEDKREPEDIRLATTAGKKGYEIIVRFLEEAKDFLNEKGEILILFSSLSKPTIILKKAGKLGYLYELKKSLSLDFEELYVYKFTK